MTVEKGATLAMTLKKIPSSALPLYTAIPKNCTKTKTRGFLEVQHNGETKYIRKSTIVWLHNEGERVSTDRLFRVRTTQPSVDMIIQHVKLHQVTKVSFKAK